MSRSSNNLIGILSFVTFLLSIPMLGAGIWLSHRGTTECERCLQELVIVLGVFFMVVSLAGLVGACRNVSWLHGLYLLAMCLFTVFLFCFTIFAFVITDKGAGEVLSGKGYKEYRLGDYSNWSQKRVNNTKNWNKIKRCLQDSKVCQSLIDDGSANTVEFYHKHLSSIQSGCCKPSNYCNFTYVSPTNWTAPAGTATYTNPDCGLWRSDPKVLCFDCQSCKAGLLDNIKHDWKKVAIVNIILLIFLIVVCSVGCCAFRNKREDNYTHVEETPSIEDGFVRGRHIQSGTFGVFWSCGESECWGDFWRILFLWGEEVLG